MNTGKGGVFFWVFFFSLQRKLIKGRTKKNIYNMATSVLPLGGIIGSSRQKKGTLYYIGSFSDCGRVLFFFFAFFFFFCAHFFL